MHFWDSKWPLIVDLISRGVKPGNLSDLRRHLATRPSFFLRLFIGIIFSPQCLFHLWLPRWSRRRSKTWIQLVHGGFRWTAANHIQSFIAARSLGHFRPGHVRALIPSGKPSEREPSRLIRSLNETTDCVLKWISPLSAAAFLVTAELMHHHT